MNFIFIVHLPVYQIIFLNSYAEYTRKWIDAYQMRNEEGEMESKRDVYKRQAQSCPGPVSGYALFYGNTYLTNEIQSEKKAEKLWKTYGSKTVQAG